jgi:hypothetical protein
MCVYMCVYMCVCVCVCEREATVRVCKHAPPLKNPMQRHS